LAIAPTFGPPPLPQLTAPITGYPVTPSPTTGRSSPFTIAGFAGHPGRNGPPECWVPSAWIAYRREFAGESGGSGMLLQMSWPPWSSHSCLNSSIPWPIWSSRLNEELLAGAAFQPPSSAAAYSSLVPTTISGLPSPFRSPTAGVSTIAPCWNDPASLLKVT
jgi:hypothetical protein